MEQTVSEIPTFVGEGGSDPPAETTDGRRCDSSQAPLWVRTAPDDALGLDWAETTVVVTRRAGDDHRLQTRQSLSSGTRTDRYPVLVSRIDRSPHTC